jgi:predicted PurR-regulated permease PerM
VIKSLNLDVATRIGLNLLALLAAILALNLGQTIIIPTVIALLLAAMLWPVVRWLNQSLRFSWGFACLMAVMGLVVLNVFVTMGFLVAIPKLLQDMPDLRTLDGQKEIYTMFRNQVGLIMPLDNDYLPIDPDKSKVFHYVKQTLESNYLTEAFLATMRYGWAWSWHWVLVMFILLFLLLEGPMLSSRVVEIFGPSTEAKGKAVHALSDMAQHVRTYLVWRTIINFSLALVVGMIYKYMGLRQPWTWAIATAMLCYIPYLGPLIAGIFPVLDAFITVSPMTALGVLLIYGIITTLEGYVIVPLVMGHTMELNATTVMLACLFWELVWGLPGLFLAMPLMAAIKAICLNVPEWQPWANLMSTSKTIPVRYLKSEMDILIPNVEETQVLSSEEIEEITQLQKPGGRP